LDLKLFDFEAYLVNAGRAAVIPTFMSARASRFTSVFLPRSAAEKRCRLAWSSKTDGARFPTLADERETTVTRLDRTGGR
jgi:hypothetical protein